jgi:biopolymer transport protein ExbD
MRLLILMATAFLSFAAAGGNTTGQMSEVVVTMEPGPIYFLDGQRIQVNALKHEFLRRKTQGTELSVVVRASREATFEHVSAIVRAAQDAGAKLNIQGNASAR